MRIAIAFYACAALAWLPPTPLHCTRARARPAAQSDDDKVAAAEDESIGRRRFVEVLDIEPRQPSAQEANRRWDASFPTWLVALALLGPLEWLIIAPVLGFLPAKDMSPDLIRGLIATVALFFVVRDTDETPLRAAVALPLSPLRLTIDDEQLPVRVARRYDDPSVTAFAARGALGATYVVMSNLYAHGIAQPYMRDAFVRLASAAALTPEELYGDPERVLWPLLGAGLQGALLFAPIVAAVLAAGSSYAVEQAIIAPWRPAAPSETEIEEACARAEKYFQVTAPPERAGPRAAAFRAAADRWRDDRRADERRDYYRAAATAGSAAVAGTWLAPCLAQLVAFGLVVVRDREGGSSQGLETT
jgi:hypothetical protein